MRSVVLICQDRQERSLLFAQLDAAGYKVTGVPGLDEALVRLPSLRPALVVFDTRGQPLDAPSLHELRTSTPTPILVLTGPLDDAQADLDSHGFDRILTRPFFIRDVVAAAAALAPPEEDHPATLQGRGRE